ncbi:hypothetical protein FQN54_009929 [Arachnomyces sp. PD_36]|nr:hypothetical protein FQN54_009929 [Arachnomyces sp. PD_36]
MDTLSQDLGLGGHGSSILSIFGFTVSYALFVAIYRVTFHPLAKYPGPFLSKLSGWPRFFLVQSGSRHLETWKQHEIYGPIVRIGPNEVSINTVAGLKGIYGSRKCNTQKSDWYNTVVVAARGPSTHSIVDRQRHAFRRRVLEHAFTEPALASAEVFIRENVQKWCKYLGDGASKVGEWTPPKNMGDWCTYLGYDIMGNLMFGKQFHCMESEEHRYVPGVMMETTRTVYVLGYLPIIRLFRPILGSPVMGLIAGQMGRDSNRYLAYSHGQMAARIAAEGENQESAQKDFCHYLLNAKDPETGQGFTTPELNADSSLVISAGSDTSSLALAATFFYLLHNPDTLTKLTDEIRSSFSSADQINSKSLINLPYLRACLDEALRLSPPTPSVLPREVLPGGLTVDEHYFPAGTVVGTSSYTIHRNTEYYPDPFAYRPERWIIDPSTADENDISSAESVAKARSAFCAFSLGPRGCIGKKVAYNEMSNALAMLLLSHDLRLAPGAETFGGGDPNDEHWGRRRVEEYQLREFFLSYRDGPKVEFRARQ